MGREGGFSKRGKGNPPLFLKCIFLKGKHFFYFFERENNFLGANPTERRLRVSIIERGHATALQVLDSKWEDLHNGD